MKNEIMELYKKFLMVKEKGWVKERRRGFTGIGYTFECLIGKDEEGFPVPDYCGIEIKTMNSHGKCNLHLFTLTPDGDYLFPIKRILEQFGCPSREDKTKKIFYRSFSGQSFTNMLFGRKGKIVVNYEDKKIDLLVIDHMGEKVDIGVSWSFEWLEERINLKLKYLALVRASSRIIDGNGYFYYYKINFYKYKGFDIFLKLIEDGIIQITFKIGYYKSGKRIGKIHDGGTDFSIDVNNINKLYDEVKIA